MANEILNVKKYRKRPVIVNAEQFAIFNKEHVKPSMSVCGVRWPVYRDKDGKYYIEIQTLEGRMRCDELDWIIEGVNGELYPCKPDIFEKTYEQV